MERLLSSIWIGLTSLVLMVLSATAFELPRQSLLALGSGEFKVRENAQLELLAWARHQPEPALDELLRQSRISEDPEVRQRCLAILRELVMDQYMSEGQGFVGIRKENKIADIPGMPDPCHAVVVIGVSPGTPAERAGIRANDLIVSLNGGGWSDGTAAEVFADQIAATKPGTKVALQIFRDGKLIDLDVVLTRRPLNANIRFLDGQNLDPEAAERAAMEAYFRDWLSERKLRK